MRQFRLATLGYEALLRRITGQPQIASPTLGKAVSVPHLAAQQASRDERAVRAEKQLDMIHDLREMSLLQDAEAIRMLEKVARDLVSSLDMTVPARPRARSQRGSQPMDPPLELMSALKDDIDQAQGPVSEDVPKALSRAGSGADIFISYSHRDLRWLEALRTALRPLERSTPITVWDDTAIAAGSSWREEIGRALSSAKVAILLVSANYLASDFIAHHELQPLLKAAETGGVRIPWVAVSASLWEATPLSRYQALNDPARPLDSLAPAARNRVLVEIASQLKGVLTAE